MLIHWLNRENNPDCILFMAGWGMDPEPFQVLAAGPVDLVMVYDYRSLESFYLAGLLADLKQYNTHLLAWSMGVWVAGGLLADFSFSSTTAIGGTCTPIDDRSGIPCKLFEEMMTDLSPQVLTDFYTAMFDNPDQADRFLNHQPNRPLQELREELITLHSACQIRPKVPDIFDHHTVTSRDRIFPPRNQIRAWGRNNCESAALPHFPFYHSLSLAELSGVVQT